MEYHDDRSQFEDSVAARICRCNERGREERRIHIRRPETRIAAVTSAIWSGNICAKTSLALLSNPQMAAGEGFDKKRGILIIVQSIDE